MTTLSTSKRPDFMKPPSQVGLAVALLALIPSAFAASTGTLDETMREKWEQQMMMTSTTARRMDDCSEDNLEACSEDMCTSDLHASAVWKCVKTQPPSPCHICADYIADYDLDFYHPLVNAYLGCGWMQDVCDTADCGGIPCSMVAPYIQGQTSCCRTVEEEDLSYDNCVCSKCDADHIDGCPEHVCTTDLDLHAFWMCNADTLLCACGLRSNDDVQATIQLHAELGLDIATSPSEFCAWPLVNCAGGRYAIEIPEGLATGVRFERAFAGNFPNLWQLNAVASGFVGSLPPHLAGSAKMLRFTVDRNKLTGSLPAEYSAWTELEQLYLTNNELSGSLSPQFSSWTKLANFQAKSNKFTGTLPPEWSAWSELKGITTSVNNLQGTLPREYAAWSQLTYIGIQDNFLTGTLPPEYAAWVNMEYDFFCFGNEFTGTLPHEWSAFTKLIDFRAHGNKLTGTFPPEYASMVAMEQFEFYGNQFTGELPESYSAWVNLRNFDIGNNKLTGTLPLKYSVWSELERFTAYRNDFSGELPASWGSWTKLQKFRVSQNRLQGELPVSYSAWVNLREFDIGNNQLQGHLRSEFSEWSEIREFLAGSNLFTGEIPANYTKFSAAKFDVSHCSLTGSLPAVGAVLVIASDNSIETADAPPSEETRELILAHNAFVQLPVSWATGKLSLTLLDLSHNDITGWPLAGVRGDRGYSAESIIPCESFLAWSDPLLRAPVMAPHFDWPYLKELRVDGCPIEVRARDFLHSISYLENLLKVSASECKLFGDIPMEAGQLAPATTDPECTSGPGFAVLTKIDLSDNAITAIDAPWPESLRQASIVLYDNDLLALHGSWFDSQYLDIRNNPLQLPVAPADTQSKCTGEEETTSFKADPLRFVASVGDEPECTTTCPVLGKSLLASTSLNSEALCRCAPGHAGTGTQCSACPEDSYAARLGTAMAATCVACPAFATTLGVPQRSSADQCACSDASGTVKYGDETCGCAEGQRMDNGASACVACIAGVEDCAWASLARGDPAAVGAGEQSLRMPIVSAGYIADPDGQDYSLWKCKSEATCLKGTFEQRLGACAPGREGTACGRCKPFHYERTRFEGCEQCADDNSALAVTIVLVACLFLVALAAVRNIGLALRLMALLILSLLTFKSGSVETQALAGVVFVFVLLFWRRMSAGKGDTSGLRVVAATSKIICRYLVLVTIVGDFNIPWPRINLLFFEWPRFLRFDVAHLIGISCLADVGLHGAMALRWALPVCCVGLLGLAALLNNLLARVCAKHWTAVSRMQVVELTLSVYQILLAQIVKMCLLPLECTVHPNDRLTLSQMPDILCEDGSEQASLRPVAITFFVVYVVFFLSFATWVSYSAPKLAQRSEGKFTFVYSDFRSRIYWFAPLIFVKEVLCAATVWIFPDSGVLQSLFMSGVLFAYLIASLYMKPFPMQMQNHLDVICHAALILQIVQSLSLKADLGTMRTYSEYSLLVTQILSVIVPGVLSLVIILKGTWTKCASKLPDPREAALTRLAFLQDHDSDSMWSSIKDIVERYKVDEVELQEIAESIEVFVSRRSSAHRVRTTGSNPSFGSPNDMCDSMKHQIAWMDSERQTGSGGDLPGLLGIAASSELPSAKESTHSGVSTIV